MCKKTHYINQCSEYLALTNEARWAQVKRLNYCINCLAELERAVNADKSITHYSINLNQKLNPSPNQTIIIF
jgi:hypothetical protein